MINYNQFIEEAKSIINKHRILDSNDVDDLNLQRLKEYKGSFIAISGEYSFDRSHEGKTFKHIFNMIVIVDRTGCLTIPIVYLPHEKQLYGYAHFMADNTCCLGLTHEIINHWGKEQSTQAFFDEIVDIFLFDYLNYKETKKSIFQTERPHKEEGVIDYYKYILGFDGNGCLQALKDIYLKLKRNQYIKGHHSCPCGSGLKIRQCHGEQFKAFIKQLMDNNELKSAFFQDIGGYCEGI